jgi:hypothetical protein
MKKTIQDSRSRPSNSLKKDDTTVTLASTLNWSDSVKRLSSSN